ncbi:MAG: FAD-dependent thymidylate synthase [Cyanobacteriota bacterium]
MTNSIDFPLVDLVSAPESTLKTIYVACRTCYSEQYPNDIWNEEVDEAKMLKLLSKVMSSGHHSTLEHCQYVFAVSGISRACSHQLVRHRHMSFSQKSQRYVTEISQFEYITPPSIEKSEFIDEYNNFMTEIQVFYTKMINAGIKAEDARFILPNATNTSMILSLNLREFIHVSELRLCANAQHEIRKLVQKMVNLAVKKDPWLKDYLVPKCVNIGYCNEFKSCGMYPAKKEGLETYARNA